MSVKTLSYSALLQNEWKKRKAVNPRYSIRAFAKTLQISYSSASLLLRGKVGLSGQKARLIASRLGFDTEETAYFIDLALSECARSGQARTQAALRLRQYGTRFNTRSLDIDAFHLIASWYSFPIMELFRIHGPRVSNSLVAKKLGISSEEVRQTLDRLRRLGIIQGDQVTSDLVRLPDGPADEATRKVHQSLLEKAKKSIFAGKEERSVSNLIIRMRREDLPWASAQLSRFRRKLAAELESRAGADAVFSLSTQIFRLDRD